MALTPEDVVNKRFQPTKFREGYDQDEVDDFLDEVVVELRRLNQENEELRQRLIASDSRINELQRSSGQAPAAPTPSFVVQPEESTPTPTPAAAVEQAPQYDAPVPTPAYSAPASDAADDNSTNNLLQLARRLHEEHVREGVEKRDALIAEGQEQAARVLQEAETAKRTQLEESETAKRIALEEAEAFKRTQLEEAETARRTQQEEADAVRRAQLEEAEAAERAQITALETEREQIEQERQQLDQERQQLESRVEELRNFEREYRMKLKGYIEGQLRELDSTNALSTGSTPGAPAYAAQQAAPNYTGFAGSN